MLRRDLWLLATLAAGIACRDDVTSPVRSDEPVAPSPATDSLPPSFVAFGGVGTAQPVGTLAGPGGIAQKVNDPGTIVGAADAAFVPTQFGGFYHQHAFRKLPNASLEDLGTLGGLDSRAYSINNAGMIVGESFTSSGNAAFRWTQGGGMVALQRLSGSGADRAMDVNDAGTVVGSRDFKQALKWSPPAYTVSVLPPLPGADQADARGINGSGDIVGASYWTVSGSTVRAQATLWPADGSAPVPVPLASTHNSAIALDLNDDGIIVGGLLNYAPGSSSGFTAVFWPSPSAAPTLTGAPGFAQGISNNDLIVGGQGGGAFIYSSETGLQSLGGTATALAVNPSGLVVGYGNGSSLVALMWQVVVAGTDGDSDGVLDAQDNCPDLANPDQANSDADAQGDACDPDDDNDGVADAAPDNCPLLANADQADEDTDGMGDACEVQEDQTITFGTLADKAFGDADFSVGASASSGLAVAFSSAGDCTVTGASVHLTGAGSCTVTAHQPGNTSFRPAPDVDRSFSIGKGSQTITFAALGGKSFGDADFGVNATASSGLAVSFSAAGSCTSNGALIHLTSAGSCTVTASQAGNDDYDAAPDVEQGFAIAKGSQTIAFADLADQTFGDPPFAVSATATSGLSVSFSSSGNCSLSVLSLALTGAGSCTVTASQPGDANYNPAPDVVHTFQIAKAPQAVAFTLGFTSKTLGDPDFGVTATGGASGNAVSFSSATPGSCTVTGTTVHLLTAGTCTVRASQAGNENYDAAPDEDRSFTVLFRFAGFFQPVDNPAVLNKAKAGSAIPIKFSLGGNQGLDIFQSSAPPSIGKMSCTAGATDAIEQTVTASSSGLTYDVTAGQYIYTWKTQSGYAGSCQKFVVVLKDGTRHEAYFQFVR